MTRVMEAIAKDAGTVGISRFPGNGLVCEYEASLRSPRSPRWLCSAIRSVMAGPVAFLFCFPKHAKNYIGNYKLESGLANLV